MYGGASGAHTRCLCHRMASGRPDATYACRAARSSGRQPRLEALCERTLLLEQLLRLPGESQSHRHAISASATTPRSNYQASQAPTLSASSLPHPFSLLPSPILSASSLPPSCQPPACILPAPSTPSPHPPHLPEHPFEREWRWPWQRGAGRRGRVVLQPRGRPSHRGRGEQGGERRRVPGCRAQQLGQRSIEQHAH